jgi:hypothetical protein
VLLREGTTVSVPVVAAVAGEVAKPQPKTIKRIYFGDRDEPLWHAAAAPAAP